jgi:hypothetical protein
MENAKDLLTQEEFIRQRSNQKFASSKNRIRFNNLIARQKRLMKGSVDRKLDQNRTILSRIIGDKPEIIVSRDYLLGAGFHFAYYSFNHEIKGVTYSGIYEYGIAKTSDDKFKIIKFNHGQTS